MDLYTHTILNYESLSPEQISQALWALELPLLVCGLRSLFPCEDLSDCELKSIISDEFASGGLKDAHTPELT